LLNFDPDVITKKHELPKIYDLDPNMSVHKIAKKTDTSQPKGYRRQSSV